MPNRAKTPPSASRLTQLGAPEAGSVSALALAREPDGALTLFVGSPVGLHRARAAAGGGFAGWERLAGAPLGILSLAVSPDYATDRTLIAGTNTGIYVSRDGGDAWKPAPMPLTGSSVPALAFSPSFAADGMLLAGTLEDGVVFSSDRGDTWLSRSFGLLDSAIYSVAFSPGFAADGTVYAGTESALYHSYNQALAWKDLFFPESAAPALSLAVGQDPGGAPIIFAGTEADGLYRSAEGGAWEKLSLPADCVNVLLWDEGRATLLAATEAGVFASADRGATWTQWLESPNIISLVSSGAITVAGSVEQGLWLAEGEGEWQSVPSLTTRSFIGLALSPAFDRDRTAYLYGPQERVWRSDDGGRAWQPLQPDLPMLDFRALAVAPDFAHSRQLAAATNAGVLISDDAGLNWRRVIKEQAGLVAYSPNGRLLAAGLLSLGLALSEDRGAAWQRVPGPWDAAGWLAALALTNAHHFYAAVLEGVGATLSLWQGRPGEYEKVLSLPAGRNPLVSFFIPPDPAPDRPWYAGFGHQVWKFSARKGRAPAAAEVFRPERPGERILLLTGRQGADDQFLLAGTGRRLFTSADGQAWTEAFDFGSDRAVALALSPAFDRDRTVYALLVGGSVCQMVMS